MCVVCTDLEGCYPGGQERVLLCLPTVTYISVRRLLCPRNVAASLPKHTKNISYHKQIARRHSCQKKKTIIYFDPIRGRP